MADNPGGRSHLPPYTSANTNSELNPSIFRRPSYASALSSNINHPSLPAGTSSYHASNTPRLPLVTGSTPTVFGRHPSVPLPRSTHWTGYSEHFDQDAGQGSRSYIPSGAESWGEAVRGEGYTQSHGAVHSPTGNMSHLGMEYSSGESPQASFFIPSYLRGSRHAAKLEAYHRRKQESTREAYNGERPRSWSTNHSRQSSSVNLQKPTPPVHRGVHQEIIERATPHVSQHNAALLAQRDADIARMRAPSTADPLPAPAPLPSRWSDTDKATGLDISPNGLDLKFSGMAKANDDAAAIRADHPMPPQCGIFYYEVTVKSKNKDGLISVGFSGANVPLNRLPGWEPDSWAYHGDDGMTFCSTSSGKPYGPKYHTADVVGCGVNFRTGQAFFTKNGTFLGTAFHNIKNKTLYPAVGMKKPNEQLGVNFGQSAFVYDIDSMVEKERAQTLSDINRANTANLSPPLTEPQLIHKLIAQYLAHDGYVETARAFATEVSREEAVLATGSSTQNLEPEEDIHAIQRQRIRLAILEGDIDLALLMLKEHYAGVLRDNENIYFKMRCRKYVEMIRKMANLQTPSSTSKPSSKAKAKGQAESYDDDDLYNDNPMDLDTDPSPRPQSEDPNTAMETSTTLVPPTKQQPPPTTKTPANESLALQTLNEILTYGQELKAEYAHDIRTETKFVLEQTLALIAYAEPLESPLRGLLDVDGRVPIAEEVNGAILVSLGKSSSAAVERLVQQTEVMMDALAGDGGTGAFVTVAKYLQ